MRIDSRRRAYMPFADHDTYAILKDDRGIITLTPVATVTRPLTDLNDAEVEAWLAEHPEVAARIEASRRGEVAPVTARPTRRARAAE